MIRLTTERLSLRDMTDEDVDFIFDIIGNQSGVPDFPRLYTREEAAAWVTRSEQRQAEYGSALWIGQSTENGDSIGMYGALIHTFDGVPFHEVGWYTHPRFRRTGFAYEAASACLDWAFEHFACDQVGAVILPDNGPSISLATRLGMTPRGEQQFAGYLHLKYAVDRVDFDQRAATG